MVGDRAGPLERHPGLLRHLTGLHVEIVEHLDVIAHEAEGHHDHVTRAVLPEGAEGLGDIGLEPGIARGAAPALVGQRPPRMP